MAPLRSRFRRHRTRPLRFPPIAIVGIVLAGAILLTVIVGNILNAVLDEDSYQALTKGNEEENGDKLFLSEVQNVNAYPHLLGSSIDDMIGQTSASVPINTPTGEMQYTSPVAEYYAKTVKNNAPLAESMGNLCYFVPYVSGVFYSQALGEQSADLRYARTGEECALMREFLRAGGSELLIMGLNVTQDNAEDVITYLRTVKTTAGSVPVGIALSYRTVQDLANWELLARLCEVCDFCAIDFTDAEIDAQELDDLGLSVAAQALLKDSRYFLNAYSMRPLFAESQTALIDVAVTLMYPTFQVIAEK